MGIPSRGHLAGAFSALVMMAGNVGPLGAQTPGAATPPSASSVPAAADEFPGTADLLQKLGALKASASPATAPQTADQDAVAAWSRDLAAFPSRASSETPEQAAQGWLDLFDRYGKLAGKGSRDPALRLESLTSLFDALPGPESWPALERLVEQKKTASDGESRRTTMLALLAHTLNNREASQWADLAALGNGGDTSLSSHLNQYFSGNAMLDELCESLSLNAENGEQVAAFWNRMLDRDGTAQGAFFQGDAPQVALPDLVGLLGPDQASALLQRLLVSHLTIRSIKGEESGKLAAKLALQSIDKIVRPPWGLTHSLEACDLYEALAKKFGAPVGDNEATAYYVFGLVLQGRSDAAVAAALAAPQIDLDGPLHRAAEKGWTLQVGDFLHQLLAKSPRTDAWELYVEVMAQLGQAPQAFQFIQATAARKDLTPEAEGAVNGALYQALLADDRVDEGVAALRQQIAALRGASEKSEAANDPYQMARPKLMECDIELAKLGRLLKNPAWESEGLQDARRDSWPEAKAGNFSITLFAHARNAFADYLLETGRNGEAAQLEIASIVDQARRQQDAGARDPNALFQRFNIYSAENQAFGESLTRLATADYQAGRWDDLLGLLDNVPYWQGTDLVEIASEKVYLYRYSAPTLGLMAARALAETGRTAEARAVLDYDLEVAGESDAAYALLLKIEPDTAAARLDQLFAQDHFQPRPLIWKASLLLSQGRVPAAQEACVQAIAIDPSDGESGKGDRMRAYSVMADICRAQKDPAKAATYDNIVAAIRLSEDADDFYDASLLTRAVGMYQQALGRFSDAYCIQSRIARQLAALGRIDEAAVHYRRAFELMPVSFGRMESHCFGCERAFQGKTAVFIAEETFQSMLRKDPRNPKLHYLLGYLRKEEGRYAEALPSFSRAVELDPDYLNAWKNIVEIGNECQLPAPLHDAAVFNLIRLDPAERHTSPDLEHVRDLAGLWKAVDTAVQQVPAKPAALLVLKAAADRRKQLLAEAQPAGSIDLSSFIRQQSYVLDWRTLGSPQKALQRNDLIRQILQWLGNSLALSDPALASS